MRDDVLPCLLPSFQGLCWCALVLLCIVQSVQPCSAGSAQYVLCDPAWHFGRPACRPQQPRSLGTGWIQAPTSAPSPPCPCLPCLNLNLSLYPSTALLDCKHFCQNPNLTANSRPVGSSYALQTAGSGVTLSPAVKLLPAAGRH